jgi:hypothetical protein
MSQTPGLRVEAFSPTDKGVEVDVSGSDPAQVADVVEGFFLSNKFRLESGDKHNATYGMGSAVGRVIGGGLVKRAKYGVAISQPQLTDPARPDVTGEPATGPLVHISIASQMSGASGSLLGISREKKQRRQFVEDLKAYLGRS